MGGLFFGHLLHFLALRLILSSQQKHPVDIPPGVFVLVLLRLGGPIHLLVELLNNLVNVVAAPGFLSGGIAC